MKLERKLDIRGPLEQAERCLGQWLKEEKRALPPAERKRAAGLMARYFYHEEEVTDELMLSFLRHYSCGKVLDMEDPASVRMEIKSVLDQSEAQKGRARGSVMMAALAALFFFLYGWTFAHRPVTPAEQADLKALVRDTVSRDSSLTIAAVWDTVKKPLHLRRYADMDQWQYWWSKSMLEDELRRK
ncbi:MAG: hypothetical protein KGQ70_07790 [Alphaproteobacteria bacterium]|nr:hypothetical protein [Alphaproteobacteria bacterium]